MVIQGTITQIVPDGGYQGSNGYIYTFQMTIQSQQGTHTGQIGSKTQTYPIAIGQLINVEMTNTQHGPRFKKFNPQYGQPQGSQPAQGQPQAAGGQNTPQPTDNRQDEIRWAQALNLANLQYCHDKIDEPAIAAKQEEFYRILTTRQFPTTMSHNSNVYDDTSPQTDTTSYDEEYSV